MNQINQLELNGVTLEYIDTGKSGSTQDTLVCIHGAGANLNQFVTQVEYFSQKYRVIVPSLRGHGASTFPEHQGLEAFSLATMAQDLIQLLEKLETGPVHVVGNSAGGVMGLELANQRPEMVESLAIYGTPAKMAFPPFLRNFTLWFDTQNATKNPEKKYKTLSKYTSKVPHTQEQVYQMFLAAGKAIPGFRYALGKYNYLPVMKELPFPICIFKCQFDRDINLVLKGNIKALEAQKAKTGLPSQVIELPGVGHIANLDNPELFNQALEKWLEVVG
jgi:3-oxoadipate enol-lactonase